MTKVAIYARYSSDLQSEHSIDDQIRICRARAEQEGWTVYKEYSDRAITGATMARPGLQAMLTDAASEKFDVLLTEALDRVGRDLEYVARIHKQLKYRRIRWITLNMGEINDMLLGLLGAMAAMFLTDLGQKVRRGLEGVAREGRSAGGKSYGYDVVHRVGPDGKVTRGDRAINEAEAEIVRRIFSEYLRGKSPRKIAFALNAEGVPGPTGGAWADTSINGNRKRGTGILNNELYIGVLVWNRQTYGKNPDSARRESRLNSPEAWVRTEVPELRIVPQELWDKVKAYQASLDRKPAFHAKARPPKLLSYLLKCGECGGGFSMISASHYGCSTARNKGTCTNKLTIRQDHIEGKVLSALSHRLMDDELCKEFCTEYTTHLNLLRMNHNSKLIGYRAELEKIEKRIAKIVQAIGDGIDVSLIKEEANGLQRRKEELKDLVANSPEAPPLVHPAMAEHYRKQVLIATEI